MKNLTFILLLLLVVVPAMAVDISVVDNDDQTITVRYSAIPGENIRGIALVLTFTDCEVSAAADSAINVEFNVCLDAAFDAETASPDSYVIGTGSALAKVTEAGALAGTGNTSCSISLGVLDELGAQAAASAGTDVALVTIALDNVGAAASVAVSLDALRGGIVGDAVVAGSMAAYVTVAAAAPPDECMKDTHPDYATWVSVEKPACWCYAYQCRGDADGIAKYGVLSVSADDLPGLLVCYGKIDLPPDCICYDFDRQAKYGILRVSSDDLVFFIASYGQLNLEPCNPLDFNYYIIP